MGSNLMTLAEKAVLLNAISEAEHAGNEKEAERLMRQLPLAPGMAKIGKETYGKAFLIENGYNLSEANREFGDGWLEN